MEASRRLSQTARVATVWSGWKFKHSYPIFSGSTTNGRFGGDRVIASNMTSQATELPYLLTKEEAFTFLDRTLGIPRSQVYAGGKSLDFLNHVIERMKITLPFTNMNLLTGKFAEFKLEDWKHHMMSGQGGTCIWINPFTKALLEQLGHTAFHVPATTFPVMEDVKHSHIGTIACDVTYPGSRHLVDLGIRWPLSEAVPLDFEKESPEYTFYKMQTKLFKKENDILLLCTPSSSAGPETQVICDSKGKNWQIRIAYWLNEKMAWSQFIGQFQQMVKNGMPFQKPFDCLFFYGFSNEKRVTIVCSDGQTHATFYNLKNHTTDRVMMTKAEVMDFFLEHYPQYSVKTLEKVFEVSKLI